ncbi:MDIS1-interacting receptor kinase [Salix suchowensis]|nr:MDIS1-interacting receptor kinase [Salix suchowensis]
MEPATSLSTIFHQLSDHPMKRFRASHAVSKIIRMLSGLIRKLMASDVVVYVVEWFNEQNVTALVAVAVIGLLMIYCCYKCLKNGCFGGQTMKAPGQDFRIPRDDFEANPSDI